MTPTFLECGGLLEPARPFPGATQAVPLADGQIQATAGHQMLRVRPDFTVTRSGATTKLIILEGGLTAFAFGDGRRQRFTVAP